MAKIHTVHLNDLGKLTRPYGRQAFRYELSDVLSLHALLDLFDASVSMVQAEGTGHGKGRRSRRS